MKTEHRIADLDSLYARMMLGHQRASDRPALLELVRKERDRLQKLVDVRRESTRARKRRSLKAKLEADGAVVLPPATEEAFVVEAPVQP